MFKSSRPCTLMKHGSSFSYSDDGTEVGDTWYRCFKLVFITGHVVVMRVLGFKKVGDPRIRLILH